MRRKIGEALRIPRVELLEGEAHELILNRVAGIIALH